MLRSAVRVSDALPRAALRTALSDTAERSMFHCSAGAQCKDNRGSEHSCACVALPAVKVFAAQVTRMMSTAVTSEWRSGRSARAR